CPSATACSRTPRMRHTGTASRLRQPRTNHPPGVNMSRVRSVDIARGAVMVLMAIDHVRVFAGVPAGGPTPSIFFTRWVTHFCAPVFVFLAGVSIYLHKDPANLTSWLLKRGAWLVLLELTYFRFVWTFNMDYQHYMLAGVIWMLGWCMILMAALVHLPVKVN